MNEMSIDTSIQLLSVYAFNPDADQDEIRFRLFQGSIQLAEMKLTNSQMPFEFPKGAIINPSWSIEIDSRYEISQLLIYWQPVHVLDYFEVI